MKKFIIATLLSTTIMPATTFAASEKEMEARIKSLEARLAKFEKAFGNVDAYVEETVSKQLSEVAPASGDDSLKVKLGPGPRFSTADGKNTFEISGKMQVDASFFNDDKADHPDATNVRRARLGISGKLLDDWKYKFEFDLAKDSTAITDIWMQYSGIDNLDLRAGQFREFLGMDVYTPNTYTLMTERAAPINAFAIPSYRKIGVAALSSGSNWSAQAGLFGERLNKVSTDDEGAGASARITYAPIVGDNNIHLGIAGQYRKPDNATNSVRFKEKAGNAVQTTNSIDVTVANTDNYTVLGLEAAGNYGPLYVQAEYLDTNVNVSTGQDASFDGYYVQGSYMLTGEARSYSIKNGSYGHVKPAKPFKFGTDGIGAWEIGGHYSNTNLNDGAYTGGEMDIIGGIINWYPNNNMRFSANYTSASTDNNAVTPNDDPKVLTFRSQLNF